MFASARCGPRGCRPVPRAPAVQRKAAAGADMLWRELATSVRGPQADAAAEREQLAPDPGYLQPLEEQGRPLPAPVRARFEPAFGYDFSDVRVHTGGFAARSARAFGALAYTYGRHVVFGAGQFDTDSPRGQRLLSHELTHVVQQSGSSSPAVQRQFGPFDLQPDVCVTAPVVGTVWRIRCGEGLLEDEPPRLRRGLQGVQLYEAQGVDEVPAGVAAYRRIGLRGTVLQGLGGKRQGLLPAGADCAQ